MTRPVLAAEELAVARGGETLIEDASLTVAPEETVLIRGPSGAGKSSLFRVLGLLAEPAGGRLRIAGEDATSLGERGRARLRRETLGFVFQDFQLVPDLTARENVRLPQEHGGAVEEEWIETLLAYLEIDDVADQYPHTLSGGEKQRVAIARALANRPALVLADEPTGQLDPVATERVLDLLYRSRDVSETALVVVSHDRQIGERFESVRRLEDGRLVESGTSDGRGDDQARVRQ